MLASGSRYGIDWCHKTPWFRSKGNRCGAEISCLNKVDVINVIMGTRVSVKGSAIKEIDGVKPQNLMLSTCDSPEYYIYPSAGVSKSSNSSEVKRILEEIHTNYRDVFADPSSYEME